MFRIAVVGGSVVLNQRLDIGETVKSGQAAISINGRKFADLVVFHDLISGLQLGALRRGDHVPGHDVSKFLGIIGKIFHVASSNNPYQFTVGIDDREAGERILFLFFHIEHLLNRLIRRKRNRGANETVQIIFDLAHFVRLRFRAEVLMDHADTAEFRHGDRHFAFSHGVHRRTDERDIQMNVAGK